MERSDIEQVFRHLGSDVPARFFDNVAEDVNWTVYGKHPLAGVYHSKEDFQNGTTRKLSALLKDDSLPLELTAIHVDGDTAVAEMTVDWSTKKGKPFLNHYCWVCRFEGDMIAEVRAYMDSVALREVFEDQ